MTPSLPEPTDLDAAAFDAFLLGLRVALLAYGIDPPAREFERPWELLRDIAEGGATLANPSDMAARFPGLGDLVRDSAGETIARERALAQRVLRGLGGAFPDTSATS